jgi:hypothetical protein
MRRAVPGLHPLADGGALPPALRNAWASVRDGDNAEADVVGPPLGLEPQPEG